MIGRTACALGIALLATAAGAQSFEDVPEAEWLELFNGRDLEGWVVNLTGQDPGEDPLETVRVEDGVMRIAYDRYERFDGDFGHIFYERPFSHYVLRLEYRFLGEQAVGGPDWAVRNSGAMLHSQSPESMGRDQDFPISIEAQFLGGAGEGERPTGNLCTPGTHVVMGGELVTDHCVESSSATYHGERWVRVELRVFGGDRIEHWIEGELVLAYETPQLGGGAVSGADAPLSPEGTVLGEGYIALQAESHPVEFRNVRLLDLVGCADPGDAGYRAYAVDSDATRCEQR